MMDNQKIVNRRRLRFACGLSLLALGLIFASCFLIVTFTPVRFLLTPWTPVPTLSLVETRTPSLLLTVTNPLGIDTIAELEEFLGAPLPVDATDIEFINYNIALQEAAVNLRFKIKGASSSLNGFLKAIDLQLSLEDGFYPFQENSEFIIDYFTWWSPKDAQIYAGGIISKGTQEAWSVMVDKTNPDLYTIYFMAILF